jgi:hypothetical protein
MHHLSRHHPVDCTALRSGARNAAVVLAVMWGVFCGTGCRKEDRAATVAARTDGGTVTEADAAVIAAGPAGTSFDLGFVKPGSRHEVVYRLQVPDSKGMTVKRIRSGCECMTLGSKPETIASGKATDVRVVFVAPGKATAYDESIFIQTDSKTAPLITLTLKADVGLPLAAEPATLDLGRLEPGKKMHKVVKLLNRGQEQVRPAYATSSRTDCIVEIPRAIIAGGGALEIPVEIQAGTAPGKQTVMVQIYTDSPTQPLVPLRIAYEVAAPAADGKTTE